MTTVAETNEITRAEAVVKALIEKGVVGLELEQAIDAVNAAQGAAGRRVERARTAGRLAQEAALERHARSEAVKRQAADRAETEMLAEHAPVVTISYGNTVVRVQLLAGLEVVRRQTCEAAAQRAVHTIALAFLDDVHRAREIGHAFVPQLRPASKVANQLLTDLAAARKHGAVTIE